MVIARNLIPSDMGVVGFANTIIGFLNQFSDCGVGNAAIRRPQLERQSLETAFTLKLVLGAVVFVIAMVIAPFARHFCDHPAVTSVTRVLAVNFLISTIGFLPLVRLTREMDYKALMIPGAINAVVRCALAITLIHCGWKFWSIVLADVGANLAGNIAMQLVRKIPIAFRFVRVDARDFLHFGLPILAAGILYFTIFNLANFLIGATMGTAMLGYYSLAFNWGSFVCGLLSGTVNSVLFPTFAAIQHDIVKMRRWYLKSLDLATFVALVANTSLLVNVHPFLVIFLGKGTDKWIPAATSFQILCIYGIVRAMTEPIANCLMARSQTKILLRASLLAGASLVAMIIPALYSHRIEWVAMAVLLSYCSQALIYIPYLRRDLSITLMEDLAGVLWPVAPAMLAGWWATHALFDSIPDSFISLACRGLFTALMVGIVHGALTRFRCYREMSELISIRFAGSTAAKDLTVPCK
jgi:lipopolysaccharide exporter